MSFADPTEIAFRKLPPAPAFGVGSVPQAGSAVEIFAPLSGTSERLSRSEAARVQMRRCVIGDPLRIPVAPARKKQKSFRIGELFSPEDPGPEESQADDELRQSHDDASAHT